ncbi:hypothetical protein GG804_22615 [Sphingomonas histidinilytica]|jgi:hypothetical protein|uniref:Ferric reductase like transmembrane component n=1 Tax=Rhizorhabdus histidinilytica TaxID=439228 RepID=A0A1T5F643_9SPHN|nr:hypothetical protein [Rhizorhabdus histidinilytica]MBO9379568.1 hypothetical protein [Rhizorhabdus histidinilytica]QEH77987.1 hypothetical protein EIK56_07375 [Sphingomonas sp. C8-2]SKB91508.1 hypothetical protein SAMN06295920_108175 [Rhizorhabdus histidinilytica]
MASKSLRQATTGRERASEHEGFLRYQSYKWLKIALGISAVALLIYAFNDVQPKPNGGSIYGYTTGTIGVLLILWLTMLGVRKRAITPGRWSLKSWTSAHVYLGLSLIVIATLHTGFDFGWNVHTLAYALMMIVIASGVFGIATYAMLPQALSANRGETTQVQMLDNLRMIDRQLNEAAQPLDAEGAAIVRMALDDDPFGGGLIARLTGHYRKCGTRAALAAVRAHPGRKEAAADPYDHVEVLLERKRSSLSRIRKHLRLKALLEVWLYLHIPLTFALIAALFVHIVSVFYYW